MEPKQHWLKNPTKQNLILVTVFGLLSIISSLVSLSFLPTNLSQKKYLSFGISIIPLLFIMIVVFVNYLKNRKKQAI